MGVSQDSNIRIILCTIAYRDRLLDYVLDVAEDLGFDGVEIWGREPHISEQFDENRVKAVQRMIHERGLTVPILGSYLRFGCTKTHAEGTAELEDTLHTAHCLSTGIVRVWASDVPSAQASEAVWDATIQECQQACDQASKLGITLAVEMHDGTLADSGASARRLAELVGHDNLRLSYQIMPDAELQTPLEQLQSVMPYVVHMHAQNYARLTGADEARRVPLGDGAIDYQPLVRHLRKSSYAGCIALEFSWVEGEGKREALAADLSYLKSLVNE